MNITHNLVMVWTAIIQTIVRSLSVQPQPLFMPNGLFYLNTLDRSISNRRGSSKFLLLSYFIEIPVLNAKSVDPD